VNGVRLGYAEFGDPSGTPVLLLHGTGSNARTWDRFAEVLAAAGHRAIAVDMRGHATSSRDCDYRLSALTGDVLGLLEVFDLRDAVLVGHSVGGYAATAAACAAPDRVTRLVLEDVAAPPRRIGPSVLLAELAGLLTGRGGDFDHHALRSLFRQLARPDLDWWAQLPYVRQPTLVVSGGPSSVIPPRRLLEVTAALPDARYTMIPAGHRVHSLAPELFAAEVLEFLQVTRSGAAAR
jgi:3-oxoadipate enol-lactonase